MPKKTAAEIAAKIAEQVKRAAGKGLNAARIFLTSRIKEELSVPAPREKVVGHAGEIYYRATTPAIKGAPPRKLSGRLRTSITSKMQSETLAIIGASALGMPSKKYPRGFPYPLYHEEPGHGKGSGKHPFMMSTYHKYRNEVLRILGVEVKSAVTKGV